jgi:hypothetical protein
LIKPKVGWSFSQLYDHLSKETNWYNEQIESLLKDTENSDKETSKKAKTLFTRESFENKRFKADPSNSYKVMQLLIVYQLKSYFEKLKSDTNRLGNKIQIASQYGKSKHPGFGYFTCFE